MSKYIKLIEANTPYAKQMTRLSNRIFGNIVRKDDQFSRKTVSLFSEKPIYIDDRIVNYYPRHVETGLLMRRLREYGLFRDEHEDFKDEMNRLRALKGKLFDRSQRKKVENKE